MSENHNHKKSGEAPKRPGEAKRDEEASCERLDPDRPRVWIGSLADYNAGILTGDWVDAAVDDEVLIAAAKNIVASSQDPLAEEWAIFDHDNFHGWRPGEYEDLTVVARVARGIAQHGPAFAAWADLHDADPDMLDGFEDAYLGHFASRDAWAESVLDEMGTREEIDRLLPLRSARHRRLGTGLLDQRRHRRLPRP
jgi:hypothetical protein